MGLPLSCTKPRCPGPSGCVFPEVILPSVPGGAGAGGHGRAWRAGCPGGEGGFHLRPLLARCQRSCRALRPCRGWACHSCPPLPPGMALLAACPPESWKLTHALGHGPHVRPRPSLRRPYNALYGNAVTSSVRQMNPPGLGVCWKFSPQLCPSPSPADTGLGWDPHRFRVAAREPPRSPPGRS